MATLEKIRNRAGLLIGVIGLALFAFIIGDFLNSGSTYWGLSKEKVGEVDGKELSIRDYQKDIETFTEVMKMQYRQMPSDGEIRELVWNNFLDESLLNQEAEKIGLNVTSAELKDVTLGENIHPMMRQIPIFYNQQGAFDKNILLNVLSNMDKEGAEQLRNYWLYWENRIKEQILAEKYQNLVLKAISATKAEATLFADLNKEEADILCVRKPYLTIPDSSVTISEQELQAKYESTKENFKTEGYRNLRAIVFDINPSEEDYADVEKIIKDSKVQLETISEEEISLFVTQVSDPEVPYNPFFRTEKDIDAVFKDFAFIAPKGSVADVLLDGTYYKTAKVLSDVELRSDSAKVSHILLQNQSLEETQKLADSLLTELKNGANFEEFVKIYSADKSTLNKGGDMGWFREGVTMLEDFDNAVFEAKIGDVVSVSTPQGIHIMKVTDKTAPVKKVKLAVIANKVEPSTTTYRRIYNDANQFILTNTTLEAFEAAAKEKGLLVRTLGPLSKNQSSVYVFEQSRPIIKWAWENPEGAVSGVFEVPNMFVVAALSEAVEPGYVPFRIASSQVKNDLIKEKKAEILIKEMSGLTDLSSLSEKADTIKNVRFSQNTLGSFGRESVVPAIASVTAVNEISQPIKGNTGVYVLKVLNKKETAPADLTQEIVRVNDNIRASVSRSLFESLKKNSDIEDNRSNFY